MEKKLNSKKAQVGGWIAFTALFFLACIGAVVGFFMYSPASTSDVNIDASTEVANLVTSLGTNVDGKDEIIRIKSSDLGASNSLLTANFDLSRLDLDTEKRKFTVKVENLLTDGYTSHDKSITTKQYFVNYDTDSSKYNVTVGNDGSTGSAGDLDRIITIQDSAAVTVTLDMNTLTEANNIVKSELNTKDVATVSIYNDANELVDSFKVVYVRTTA